MTQQRPGMQHPEEWRKDLNPDPLAGQNVGTPVSPTERGVATAFDLPELHSYLPDLSKEELQSIPVIASGTRLEQGATYMDLCDPTHQEFTATGDMEVESGHWYASKKDVIYQIWNRLIGIEDPERTAETLLLKAAEESPCSHELRCS